MTQTGDGSALVGGISATGLRLPADAVAAVTGVAFAPSCEERGAVMGNADNHLRTADQFNARDWKAIAADLAENCELTDHARNYTAKGREQWIEAENGWVAAFSDARVTDTRIIDGGDATVLLFTGAGTNDGSLGPLPATGRTINLPFCEVRYWDADGRTTRAEWFYDQMSMLVQLGHTPPSEG
jgi:hypothetical protein